MSTAINIESLSKQELEHLIHQGQRRIQTLKAPTELKELVEDERIYSIVNDMLVLAYQAGVPKLEIFTAVAGALRQPLEQIAAAIPQHVVDHESDAADVNNVGGTSQVQGKASNADEHNGLAETLLSGSHRPQSIENQSIGLQSKDNGYDKSGGAKTNKVVYAHPVDRDKTWDGRGSMPKWLRDALSFGRKLEEFRVERQVRD